MTIRILAAFIALCLNTLAFSQVSNSGAPSNARLRSFLEMVNKPVVLPIPSPASTRILRDRVYKKTPTTELKLDLYRPQNDNVVPIVVLIHGGVSDDLPLRPKDWGLYQSWGKLIAGSGIGAITFNHRVGFPDPHLKEGQEDLRDAIKFVKSQAAEWKLDTTRICLVAFSAGGPLLSDYVRQPSPEVKCLGAFYAFMDLRQSDLHKKYMSRDQIELFSNSVQLNSSSKLPMFLARAGADQIPGIKASEDSFIDSALATNSRITVINHPDGVHGFDNQNDDDRSREILRSFLSFLKSNLGLAPN